MHNICYDCDHRIVGLRLSAKPRCKLDLKKLITNTSTCDDWAERFDAKPIIAAKEKKNGKKRR